MDSPIKLFALCFFTSLVLGDINGVESGHHHHLQGLKKLFVFGDSLVDTGNIKKSQTVAWRVPYGITFPGKPSGRFSDGRVSTDYLARLMRIKSPITYLFKDYVGMKRLQYGMNFAYGGTGIFTTHTPLPNMTIQIDFFEQLLGNVYSQSDLSSSLALVSGGANDYSYYLAQNLSLTSLPVFIKQVVDQTEVHLRRIHALGVKKIVVPSMPPLGCFAVSSQSCDGNLNAFVEYHNSLLQRVVTKLNNETKHSTFVIFDYYNAFLTVFKNKGVKPRSTKFKTPLKACCEGSCGSVDENGVKMYTLCDDPKSAFFWDAVHPSQEGWRSVYSVLGKSLAASLINP